LKKFALLFILFSTTFVGKGQNLVPNGDFEQYSSCPIFLSQIDSALFWFNPTTGELGNGGTSDYFNSCSNPNPNVGVPNNLLGYQMAHSGVGYSGIIPYEPSFPGNYREYIEVTLTSSLVLNQCYHFEMYLSIANISFLTIDNIGVYFSDTAITGINNSYPLPFIPQINNMPGNFITDTLNWTLVNGNYIATGGESYFIIGNFNDDANTNTIVSNNNSTSSITYFYIDDVSLTPCTGIEEVEGKGQFALYPNPAGESLTLTLSKGEGTAITQNLPLKIYDMIGKEVLKSQFSIPNTQINITHLPSGIYFIEINDGKIIMREKFCKK